MGEILQPCQFQALPEMAKPKRVVNGVEITTKSVRLTKFEREAEKQKIASMQFNLFMKLLVKPLIRNMKTGVGKLKKRALDALEDAKAFTSSVPMTQSTPDVPRQMDWSNQALLEAHQWVLSESMEVFRYEDNAEEKLDVLEWVFSPCYIEKLGKSPDGRSCVIRRHASNIPFSFENCCRAVGMTDPDSFREELVEQMNDELKPLLRKYLANFTGKTFNNVQ